MKLKYISWIPGAVIMISMCMCSSKAADESNDSSLSISDKIFTIYENITQTNYVGEEKEQIMGIINHIVRKTAHFTEYAVLSITFAMHLTVIGWRRRWILILPVILSFLYASTDEFHQTFVSERAGMFKDVMLDTSGALVGSILFTLLLYAVTIHKIKKRKQVIN